VATVNRVLFTSGRVRIQTREKAEAIARKMGFIGDATQPRNTARVKEYRLGFILPPSERPSYALRQSGRTAKVAVIGFGAIESVRPMLIDGTLALAITHPIRRVADEAISGMVNCVDSQSETKRWDRLVPFEIYTRENV
jgi:hypothetical protein